MSIGPGPLFACYPHNIHCIRSAYLKDIRQEFCNLYIQVKQASNPLNVKVLVNKNSTAFVAQQQGTSIQAVLRNIKQISAIHSPKPLIQIYRKVVNSRGVTTFSQLHIHLIQGDGKFQGSSLSSTSVTLCGLQLPSSNTYSL